MNTKIKTFLGVLSFSVVIPLFSYAGTLSQSVQFAVNNNPDVGYQIATKKAWGEEVAQAYSQYLPTVDISAGYGTEWNRSPQSRIAPFNQAISTVDPRSEFGVNVVENVFDGFNTVHEVKRTTAETRQAAYHIKGASNDLALNVTQQYLNILLEQKLVQLAQTNLHAHYGISGMIGDRKEAGLAREADVTQSHSRIHLAESNLITEKSNLADAITEYGRYVKAMPTNLIMPRVPGYPAIPRTLRDALNIAERHHPVLKSAQAAVQAAIEQHEASKFTLYPKVDLVFVSQDDRNIDGTEGPFDDQLLMVRANYNIFKGGAHIAEQKESAYKMQEAMALRNKTILQVEESVNLAWTAMIYEQQRAAKLLVYRNEANSTLSAFKEQFKLDKRTLLDVLDEQNEFYKADSDYQKARFSAVLARYRLLNSMGTLNQYLGVTLPKASKLRHMRSMI